MMLRLTLALVIVAAIPRAAGAEAANFAMPPLETFSATIERPLFAPDRRPHVAPLQVFSTPAPIALSGIVIENHVRYALINEGAPVLRRVAEGDQLAAGTVKRILPDRIVLAAPGGETVVKLFDAKSHTGSGSTPVAPQELRSTRPAAASPAAAIVPSEVAPPRRYRPAAFEAGR